MAAVREVFGALACAGHDIHSLLDRYTLEQIEQLAACVWQHNVTRMSVVAYALGGAEAQERVPDHPSGDGTSRPQGDQKSIGWENAHGEWRLYERGPDGQLRRQRPKITPEEDQRRKNHALVQLFGVQSRVAEMKGGKAPTRAPQRAKGGAGAVAEMRSQLSAARDG